MKNHSVTNYLKKNMLSVGLNIFGSGLAAITTLVIAKEIGAAQYGEMTLVLAISTFMVVFLLMGINFALYHYMPNAHEEEHHSIIGTAFISSVVFLILFFFLSMHLSAFSTKTLRITVKVWEFSIWLAISTTMNSMIDAFLRGKKRFIFIGAARVINAVFYLSTSAVFLFILDVREFTYFIILLIAGQLVFIVAALIRLRFPIFRFSIKNFKRLYKYGFYISITTIILMFVFSIDVFILNYYSTTASVGIFSVYLTFGKKLFVVVFNEGIGVVLLTTLAKTNKNDIFQKVKRIIPYLALLVASGTFLLYLVFFIYLKSKYPFDLFYMFLVSAGMAFHAIYNLFFSIFSMDGESGAKVCTKVALITLPLSTATQIILIKYFDIIGGFAAFIVTNLIIITVFWIYAERMYPGKLRKKDR
jgi:O-antigen/teichoic acid export membrane protein